MKKINLTGKRGGYAIVDDDKAWLAQYKWYQNFNVYARYGIRRGGKMRIVFLHHAIVGYPLNKLQIDHINGDKLDNRRSNLRIVTRSFNATNHKNPQGRGAYGRNVSKDTSHYRAKPFQVLCRKNGFHISGGYFTTAEEAQEAAATLRKELGYAD